MSFSVISVNPIHITCAGDMFINSVNQFRILQQMIRSLFCLIYENTVGILRAVAEMSMRQRKMYRISASVHAISEVDVGDLHVTIDLQRVDLVEGRQAVEEVEQVLPVHKHLEPLVPTADGHLRGTDGTIKATPTHGRSRIMQNSLEISEKFTRRAGYAE